MSQMLQFQEAYTSEVEEFDQLRNELNIIDTAWGELRAEQKKAKPKYVRVARKYYEDLKEIFWYGVSKREAQEILSELYTSMSMPLSALERNYYITDDGKFVELDSYTNEPIEEIITHRNNEWENDYNEVQAMIAPELDILKTITTRIQNPVVHVDHKIIHNPKISEYARHVQALRELGYSEEQISAAMEHNYPITDDDDIPFWDMRDIPSTPIKQAEELTLQPKQWHELRRSITDLRSELYRLIAKYKDMEAEFIQLMYRASKGEEVKSDNPYFEEFLQEVSEKNLTIKGKAWWYTKHFRSRAYIKAMNDVQALVPQFIEELEAKIDDYLAQDVAIVYMMNDDIINYSLDGEDDISPIAYSVRVPPDRYQACQNLGDFVARFGDEIIDEMERESGRGHYMSDAEIRSVADHFTEQIISTFKDPEKGVPIEQTKPFAKGVFDAINAGLPNPREHGFNEYYRTLSPRAYRNYKIVLDGEIAKGEPFNKALTKALRSYWGTCLLKGKCTKEGCTIQSMADPTNSKFISWKLAFWKRKHGELIVSREQSEILFKKFGIKI